MNSKIQVSLSPQKKRFFFRCNFSLNSVLRKIPAARFEKSAKLWTASFAMQNVAFLSRELTNPHSLFEMDDESRDLIRSRQSEISALYRIERTPFPSMNFRFPPYPHQKEALDFISDMNVFALFLDMGLGKSYVTLYKFLKEYAEGKVDTLLVVCPTSLRRNWVSEIRTHLPPLGTKIFMNIVDLQSKKALAQIENDRVRPGIHILIAGIEALSVGEKKGRAWDIIDAYTSRRPFMMFVDESSDIKNMQSTRTENCVAIGQKAKIRGIGTGTEISNSIIDLYSQFQFLHPDIIGIGSLSAFKARYIEFGGFENKQPIGFKNIDELMDLIRPFVFKRTTAECGLNLPPTYTQIRSVPLSTKQRALYNKIRKEKLMYIKTLDENLVIESAMDAYNKLQQVVGGFLIYETGETETTGRGNIRILKETERVVEPEHNPKIAEMLKILTEHPGKSTIIWAKFTEEVNLIIEALERKFGAGSVSRFDGEVKDADREDQKKAFLDGRTRFFVSKASSGGKGLTLNISDFVIYFSNSFKFVDREQSRKRNDRIGQTKNVTYIDLVAEDTIDEDILSTLRDKKDLADFIKDQLTNRAPLLTK